MKLCLLLADIGAFSGAVEAKAGGLLSTDGTVGRSIVHHGRALFVLSR